MDKKLFKSLLLLVTFCVFLVVIIVKIDWLINFISTIFNLLSPLFIGLVIAFILDPMCEFFIRLFSGKLQFKSKKKQTKKDGPQKDKADESKDENAAKKHKKTGKIRLKKPLNDIAIRALAIVVSYALFLSFIALILLSFIPQVIDSAKLFTTNFNGYIENLEKLTQNITGYFNIEADFFKSVEDLVHGFIENFSTIATGILPQIFDFTKSFASQVTNWIIGMVMSVYMLVGKKKLLRQFKDFAKAFLPEKSHKKIAETMNLIVKTFSGFVSGRFIDSVLVGIICYIGMRIFGFSYPLLISVIIGVTNVIPVFGPFLGAAPSIFILLMVDPLDAFWFAVFIAVLQQVDGNIIDPRITGDSIGLPALWSMLAIFVGGGLFGILGMLVGVPTFAVIYALVQRETSKRLEDKKWIDTNL